MARQLSDKVLTMRLTAVTLCAFVLLTLFSQNGAAQQLAIPTTIKAISKSPSKIGRLVLLRGYIVTSDGETRLQEADSNRQVILDFSQAPSSIHDLAMNRAVRSPIEMTGRVTGVKKNGSQVFTVIWATPLTSSR